MGPSLLIQQNEDSGPHLRFATWCKQPKISHCVPIGTGDMLREDGDKFLVCILHKNRPFTSCILCQVLDAVNSDPRKTMLGNWRSSNRCLTSSLRSAFC
jgi:hypothetical protein